MEKGMVLEMKNFDLFLFILIFYRMNYICRKVFVIILKSCHNNCRILSNKKSDDANESIRREQTDQSVFKWR